MWSEDLLHLRTVNPPAVRRRVLSIQETLWIASERSLWRFGSLPWRLTWVIGRGLCDLSSSRIRWGLGVLSYVFRTRYPGQCVLRFKYLAALTRRTVVRATRTGPTNHCLQRVTGFILPFPLLTVTHCEVISYLSYLIDFIAWLLLLIGFILSSILILLPSCY